MSDSRDKHEDEMGEEFLSAADDFFVNVNLQTVLDLPSSRETVLSFMEVIQKEFPELSNFYHREGGEFILEGDHERGTYPWLEIQKNRLTAGHFNPPALERAYHLHRRVLERCRYYLGMGGLDLECLDVLYGFNLNYSGNRDAIVAQALLGGSPLWALAAEPGARPLEFQPDFVVSLDDACCLQARLSIETRSSSYQVRTGQYEEEPITVYLTVRRYPGEGKPIAVEESFAEQCQHCEDLAQRIVVPQVIQPIAAAIAAAG
jgi:hypothetical protein